MSNKKSNYKILKNNNNDDYTDNAKELKQLLISSQKEVTDDANLHSNNKPERLFDLHAVSAMSCDLECLADSQQNLILRIKNAWRPEWLRNGVQRPTSTDSCTATNQNSTRISSSAADFQRLPDWLRNFAEAKNTSMVFSCGGVAGDDANRSNEQQQKDAWLQLDNELIDRVTRAERLYEMDEMDCHWLALINTERRLATTTTTTTTTTTEQSTKEQHKQAISATHLEIVVESLERVCFTRMQTKCREIESQFLETDENAKCDICQQLEGEPGNELVFCEECYVCVHQACYGVPVLPPGVWLCARCESGAQSAATPCELCPLTGGAMKPLAAPPHAHAPIKWAHVLCALWLPEVYFGDVTRMQPICNANHPNVVKGRRRLLCSVCKQRGVGAAINCTQPHCRAAFHVSCAVRRGFHLDHTVAAGGAETQEKKSGRSGRRQSGEQKRNGEDEREGEEDETEESAGDPDDIKALCALHSKLYREGSNKEDKTPSENNDVDDDRDDVIVVSNDDECGDGDDVIISKISDPSLLSSSEKQQLDKLEKLSKIQAEFYTLVTPADLQDPLCLLELPPRLAKHFSAATVKNDDDATTAKIPDTDNKSVIPDYIIDTIYRYWAIKRHSGALCGISQSQQRLHHQPQQHYNQLTELQPAAATEGTAAANHTQLRHQQQHLAAANQIAGAASLIRTPNSWFEQHSHRNLSQRALSEHLCRIRFGMDRSRLILDMVNQREKRKRRLLELDHRIVRKQLEALRFLSGSSIASSAVIGNSSPEFELLHTAHLDEEATALRQLRQLQRLAANQNRARSVIRGGGGRSGNTQARAHRRQYIQRQNSRTIGAANNGRKRKRSSAVVGELFEGEEEQPDGDDDDDVFVYDWPAARSKRRNGVRKRSRLAGMESEQEVDGDVTGDLAGEMREWGEAALFVDEEVRQRVYASVCAMMPPRLQSLVFVSDEERDKENDGHLLFECDETVDLNNNDCEQLKKEGEEKEIKGAPETTKTELNKEEKDREELGEEIEKETELEMELTIEEKKRYRALYGWANL